MEEFMKAKNEFERQKSLLTNRLYKVLGDNGYDNCFAWFNWNEDAVTIVWSDTKLPRDVFIALEIEFGRINCIHNPRNPIGDKIFIVFEKEQFR